MQNMHGYHLKRDSEAAIVVKMKMYNERAGSSQFAGVGTLQLMGDGFNPRHGKTLRGDRTSAYIMDEYSFFDGKHPSGEMPRAGFDGFHVKVECHPYNTDFVMGPSDAWYTKPKRADLGLTLPMVRLRFFLLLTTSLMGIGHLRKMAMDELTHLHRHYLSSWEASGRHHSHYHTSTIYSLYLWKRIRVIGSWDKQLIEL